MGAGGGRVKGTPRSWAPLASTRGVTGPSASGHRAHLGVSPERGQSAASVEGADTGLTEQKPELVGKERGVSRRAEGLHEWVCGRG